MLNSILLSAALLLGGPSVSALQMNVEPQTVEAPFSSDSKMMSEAVERILIEKYAAPHWHLSLDIAWSYYSDYGYITITEISPNVHYLLAYDGGILDVFIDPTNF